MRTRDLSSLYHSATLRMYPRANNAVPSDLQPALVEAINQASTDRLRNLQLRVCRESVAVKAVTERELLTGYETLVPYHTDTASEEASESDDSDDSDWERIENEVETLKRTQWYANQNPRQSDEELRKTAQKDANDEKEYKRLRPGTHTAT